VTPALALALLLAGEAGAGDPCAAVAPVAADPAASREYRAVGDAELARGARATAAAAYRAAAARDPDDRASRAALARLCSEGPQADPFAEGVAAMDAGDPRRALRALRAARGATAPTPSAALLEGICHYDLGEDAEAEALLKIAETAPAHRDAARLHLGLIRLRAGDGGAAAALFDAAGGGPSLSEVAGDLARLARREGRLVLSLLAESGWDSNVTLAPAEAVPGPEADGAYGLTGAALWRPLGTSGPYLRGSAGLTEQLSLGAYDFAAWDAAAGWQARVRSLTLLAEYDLGARTLGGEPFLTAQRLLGSAILVRRGVALSATYSARLEDYAQAYRDYSGVLHRAELRLAFPIARALRGALSYGAARDLARAVDLSYVEHGPRAELRVALGRSARLGVEGGASFRRYDAGSAAGAPARADEVYDASALAELDLGARLVLRTAVQGRVARSSLGALEYDKIVPSLGLLWMAGY
jgi:tetratricopeptide (TPR) repeat protein